MRFCKLPAIYAGKFVANINVLLVIGVEVERILNHEQFKPQMVGNLLRIHMMVVLQTGDIRHRNARALNAGPPAADERVRGDARRQRMKLDAFDVLKDVRLLPLYLFFDAFLCHCFTFQLPGIAPAAHSL